MWLLPVWRWVICGYGRGRNRTRSIVERRHDASGTLHEAEPSGREECQTEHTQHLMESLHVRARPSAPHPRGASTVGYQLRHPLALQRGGRSQARHVHALHHAGRNQRQAVRRAVPTARDLAFNFAHDASRIAIRHGLPNSAALPIAQHKDYDRMFADIRDKLHAKSGDPVKPEHLE
ncbi:Acetyl-CoA carboxylase alpha subunit [Pseudomonas savastanoi pv. fraxini]|nr:Acetyl-CoA carboxylase alpha subunit [Pseudomonas savastanoi pv. fraxini]RMR76484.1 Acetyl-CoA carboxylase alpha subunit [Pseudomonas savastanoi pv. fraxini]